MLGLCDGWTDDDGRKDGTIDGTEEDGIPLGSSDGTYDGRRLEGSLVEGVGLGMSEGVGLGISEEGKNEGF